jgi:hypothetical protein
LKQIGELPVFANNADQLVIWLAKGIGIFVRSNIDAQPIYFTGGTMSVTAMVSGDTPLIQASGPGIVSAGLAGADPVYVGDVVSLDYWLKTQPEIKTPEPLKGGTIVVACKPAARRNASRDGSTASFGQYAGPARDVCRAKKGLSLAFTYWQMNCAVEITVIAPRQNPA